MKRRSIDLMAGSAILILIAIDQIIKVIVKGYYGVKVPIIQNKIYFKPTLNSNYSWLNSMFKFGWGKAFHIIINVIFLFLAFFTFKYIYNKSKEKLSIKLLEVFLISGILCSLIDKIFWNGSLDYIYLKGLFVFDLKDCYITVFEIEAITLLIRNRASISKISNKELIKDYIKFIKSNFTTSSN